MPAVNVPEQTADETDRFELVYEGPDVDRGTMSARELAEVLSGMTRAFSTVAYERELGDKYDLRVRDIEHRSFHLLFEAIEFAKANPEAATAIVAGSALALQFVTTSVSGAYKIITDIGAMLEAKKQAKGERIARMPTEFNDGAVWLTTSDEELILLSKEQYELLLSQKIDRQLPQVVSPLAPQRINRFLMRRKEVDLATVDVGQRDYFDYREILEDQSREGTEIVGTLNSLTKTNLRGTFYTTDGIHVPYRYTGGDIAQLLRGFSAREPLKVRGKIKFGTDGVPISIDVQEIEFVQRRLGE